MDIIKLGQMIKNQRIKKGITQETLGELTEITSSYIGQIERGERNVTLGKIVKIANVLDISVDSLLRVNERKEDEELKSEIYYRMINKSEKEKEMIIEIIKVIDNYSDK